MVPFVATLLTIAFYINLNEASFKTGVCMSPKTENLNCDDLNQLTSPVWWYNWGNVNMYEDMGCTGFRNAEFIPMIWGYYGGDLTQVSIPEGTTTILGFNEPNIVGQAEIDPAYAVEGWKKLQAAFPNKILISPSASPCSGNNCYNGWTQEAWFDKFFEICNGTCRIDYISVHLYWCYNDTKNNVYDWIGSLGNIYNRYEQKYKLWLTEFNCWGASDVGQKRFMEAVIPALESTDYIEKYSWFIGRTSIYENAIQLFTSNTSEAKLTTLGETYNKYSLSPTISPSLNPTVESLNPTKIPSIFPTNNPSKNPTNNPINDISNTTLHSLVVVFIMIGLCFVYAY